MPSFRPQSHRSPRLRHRRAFTLLELLAVVAILGIAAAVLIPSMGSVGILRVQAAVRTVISDITFAQSDAVAFQERRAVIFDVEESTYRLVQVPGATIDPDHNTLYDPSREGGQFIVDFKDKAFGGARITNVNFDGGSTLIFDAMGGPVANAADDEPGAGGSVTIVGSGSTFQVTVDAFTGRVSANRVSAPEEEVPEEPEPEGPSGGGGSGG